MYTTQLLCNTRVEEKTQHTYTRKNRLIKTGTKAHACRNCQWELSVLVNPSLSTPTHPCCGSLQIFRNKRQQQQLRVFVVVVVGWLNFMACYKQQDRQQQQQICSCSSSSSTLLLLLLLTTSNLLQTIIRNSASKSRSSNSSSVCKKQTVGARGRTDLNPKNLD